MPNPVFIFHDLQPKIMLIFLKLFFPCGHAKIIKKWYKEEEAPLHIISTFM